MAGVFPLKNWYELVTFCPADSSVIPATSASRHYVGCNGRKRQCINDMICCIKITECKKKVIKF